MSSKEARAAEVAPLVAGMTLARSGAAAVVVEEGAE